MRRLILLLTVVAVVGLVIYRQRALNRWEHELAICGHGGDTPGR